MKTTLLQMLAGVILASLLGSQVRADLQQNTERLNIYLDQLRDERLERERLERERLERERLTGEWVDIPSGCFQMGSTRGATDEKPVHEVCLKGFQMGRYEVTQGQWRALMGGNPSHFSSCGDDCPVEKVSWNDIQEFLKILKRKTGLNFRLPSEAEWEYACRGGVANETYCGGNEAGRVGWYKGNSGSKTHGVGGKAPNGFGLYDMSGNVWEWTEDCWNDSYNGAPRDGSAWHSGDCSRRVLRGGSWDLGGGRLRAAPRYRITADFHSTDNGFRLLLQDRP